MHLIVLKQADLKFLLLKNQFYLTSPHDYDIKIPFNSLKNFCGLKL